MELPKNITQIGETNPHCKIYVEDYVISYIKQLNHFASEKEMAVALYGIRKEEDGISYLFLYGACRLVFLQKECRHLSQAVLQEVEKQRRKFFPDHIFLGYRLLDGEMVEGFHICEQDVCRYVEGYAQFYEKNDAMLALMLEERQEASRPEAVDQEKYNVVKKRQEERRALAEGMGGHALLSRLKALKKPISKPGGADGRLLGMKLAAAAVFGLLCVTGLASMVDGGGQGGWQAAVRQMVEHMSEKQLPDALPAANGSAQVGTIVAEDRLIGAIQNENKPQPTPDAAPELTPEPTPEPTPPPTPEPTLEPTPPPQEPTQPVAGPTAELVAYVVQRGDTLTGICVKRYGSDVRVPEICSLNQIEDPDDIKEGEKIFLPQ